MQEKKQKDREQPLQEGSRKWRMIKGREKEVWEEEQQAMPERKQPPEEKAAFLQEQAASRAEQPKSRTHLFEVCKKAKGKKKAQAPQQRQQARGGKA